MSHDLTLGGHGAVRRVSVGPLLGRLARWLTFTHGGTPAATWASAREQAAEVRAMAWRVQHSEPGFASDLLAAADRHERQFGIDG